MLWVFLLFDIAATLLTTFRMIFSMLAGMLSALCFGLIADSMATPQQGYLTAAGVMAVFIIVPTYVTFICIREPRQQRGEVFLQSEAASRNELPFRKGVSHVFHNTAYVSLCIVYVFGFLALTIVQVGECPREPRVRYWVVVTSLLLLGRRTTSFFSCTTSPTSRITRLPS